MLLSYGISIEIAFYVQRENGQALTDEEIRAEVRTFMFAGLDTVTSGEEFRKSLLLSFFCFVFLFCFVFVFVFVFVLFCFLFDNKNYG